MANDINIVVSAQVGDATRGLMQVQKQVQQVDRQIKQSTVALRQNANQFNSTAVATNKFAKGALQQAGYQIGDFAVQLSGGQNALQAFGQQGSQLAGIFGPLGAVVGAAIAIFAAVGVAAQRAGVEFIDFAGASGRAQAAIDKIGKSTKDLTQDLALMASGLRTVEQLEMSRAITLMREEIALKRVSAADAAARSGRNDTSRIIRGQITAMEELLAVMETELQTNVSLADAFGENLVYDDAVLRRMTIEASNMRSVFNGMVADKQEDLKNAEAQIQAITNQQSAYRQFAESRRAAEFLSERQNMEIAQRQKATWSAYYASRIAGERTVAAEAAAAAAAPQVGRSAGIGGPTASELEIYNLRVQLARQAEAARKAAEAASLASKSLGVQVASSVTKAADAFGTNLSPQLMRIKSISESVGYSIENAMMSAVDGTNSAKAAFKSMASEIIKELYRIFVVKRITGMISNAIGLYSGVGMTSAPAANPLAGLSGSQMLPRRAMGGQVTGGRPYMVGERGPEMIVPQRNGNVVPNNQLGGGGVTVNQTINVSTGVQQTVRAEIKTLMPQIAEASKAAVADAVRRGGSYGRAFA